MFASLHHFASTLYALEGVICMLLQVGAYAFACQRGSWPFHYRAVCLLPLMDMLNHRSDGQSNAVVDQNKNGTYSCYAKRDIKAGEEVLCSPWQYTRPCTQSCYATCVRKATIAGCFVCRVISALDDCHSRTDQGLLIKHPVQAVLLC